MLTDVVIWNRRKTWSSRSVVSLPRSLASICAPIANQTVIPVDAAATERDPHRRIAFVAAFAMSNYSSTIGRIAKPFNPMLVRSALNFLTCS